MADPSSLPASRLSGMNTQHSTPSRAACAATLFARLPVDAHASTLKPSSNARVAATETTRSLYDSVGWVTEPSWMYSSRRPRGFASRQARSYGLRDQADRWFGPFHEIDNVRTTIEALDDRRCR